MEEIDIHRGEEEEGEKKGAGERETNRDGARGVAGYWGETNR